MDDFRKVIDYKLLEILGYDLTLGQLLIIPLVILLGYLILRWLVRSIVSAMTKREFNPDIIHVVRRGVYIVGLVVLIITTLDLLSIPLTAFAFCLHVR